MPNNLSDLSNLHEHPSYQLADKVKEICSPLFNYLPIIYFGYVRVYIGEQVVKIVDLPSSKHCFNWYWPSNHPCIISKRTIYQWLEFKSETNYLKEVANKFNYKNGILLGKVHPDHIETLEFVFSNPNIVSLEFCNNKELLNKFFLYFKAKAHDTIEIIERDPLYLPRSRFTNLEDCDPPYVSFCQSIKTNKLPLKFRSQEVVFTTREFETMSLLAKGKTVREAARILQISPRTLETHLYNAKNKTNSFTVSILLDQFTKSLL